MRMNVRQEVDGVDDVGVEEPQGIPTQELGEEKIKSTRKTTLE